MTRSNRSMVRLSRNLVALIGAALLSLVFTVTAAYSNPKIKCGGPMKTGEVTITITLKKGAETHEIVIRDIFFPRGTPAADKAAFIADFINQTDIGTHIHASHANGSDEVELFGLYGWEISGHCIGQDGTGEPDWLAYDGSSAGGEALCSLSGVATGTSPIGGPGFAGLQAFGAQAQLQTMQGMSAQDVETMLMQQLQSQNVPVRWAVPSDFAGAFRAMQHDDSVLLITSPNGNAPGSIFEVVADQGLQLDLMAIADPPNPTSGLSPVSGTPQLRLDVTPSVFSFGRISVRYASAGSGSGFTRLTAHDVAGRNVATLFEGNAGSTGSVFWDGTDRNHISTPAGVYFLRLETPDGTIARRVTRVR